MKTYIIEPVDRARTATEEDPEFRAAYDDFLNEAHGEVTIAGLAYSTAFALRELDPTAYHEGFLNWLDGLEDAEYPEGGRWQCPVCETNHANVDDAAECCAEEGAC